MSFLLNNLRAAVFDNYCINAATQIHNFHVMFLIKTIHWYWVMVYVKKDVCPAKAVWMSDRASHDFVESGAAAGAVPDTESDGVSDTDTVSLSDSDCVAGIEDMTVVDSGSTAGLDAGAGCEGSKCSPLSEFTPPRTGRSGDCEAIKNGHEFAFSMSPSKRKSTSLSSVSTRSPTCSSPARGLQLSIILKWPPLQAPWGFYGVSMPRNNDIVDDFIIDDAF